MAYWGVSFKLELAAQILFLTTVDRLCLAGLGIGLQSACTVVGMTYQIHPNPHSYNVEQQFFQELLWKLPDATSQELAVLDAWL